MITKLQGAFDSLPDLKMFNAPLVLLSTAFSVVTPMRYSGRGRGGIFRAIVVGMKTDGDIFK